MGLFDIFNMIEQDKKREQEKKKRELESEMEAYNLTDEEKDLVRSGQYDPWDFDNEGPFEDDDYYNDDSDYDD